MNYPKPGSIWMTTFAWNLADGRRAESHTFLDVVSVDDGGITVDNSGGYRQRFTFPRWDAIVMGGAVELVRKETAI